MPGYIAFMNALLALIGTGIAAYAGASLMYGGFHFLSGDQAKGKPHLIHAMIGAGLILTAGTLGAAVALLPHA